jgi:cytochrome c-type biogenesis protein CcmH
MMRTFKTLALAGALLAPLKANAVEPGEQLADPALEARARAIASELRCLVCQNQSIDDSDAPLAKDLRLMLREQLKNGASDADAKQYLVARYGDFVLLRPPLKPTTLALWGAPVLAVGVGGLALAGAYRRRKTVASPARLSAAEAEQLKRLGVEDESGE